MRSRSTDRESRKSWKMRWKRMKPLKRRDKLISEILSRRRMRGGEIERLQSLIKRRRSKRCSSIRKIEIREDELLS
jgi:hypothetical protein